MFKNIPIVLTADKLLEFSLKNSKKIKINDRNTLYRKKKTIIARTNSFSNNIITKLEQYVKKFPSIDNLPLFYQDIIDIKLDKNKLKKSLGAIDWARKTCQMIYSKQSKSLQKSKKINFLMQKQKEIYGRLSSVVKQIKNDLLFLSKAQNIIKDFPEIKDIFTVVISGYPNVGKSSVLKSLSSANPKISQYPFTTKEIHVGHIERKVKYEKIRVQLIDTPGLLDRPFEKRNDIEKQAIAALSNLADIIVFLIDPTETCGYSLENQLALLSEIKKTFNNSNFIIVENKLDLKKTNSKNLKISCKNGKGIDFLYNEIFKLYDIKK
jgi:nucleolar GTP-binding protein